MVIISETQAGDAANMECGINEATSQVRDMVTRAQHYGFPDTAHELRVALVALERASTKAQAAA